MLTVYDILFCEELFNVMNWVIVGHISIHVEYLISLVNLLCFIIYFLFLIMLRLTQLLSNLFH